MNRRTFFKGLLTLPAVTAAVVKAEAEPKYLVGLDPGIPGSDMSGMMIFESTPGSNDAWFYRLWVEQETFRQMGIPADVWCAK